jgi:hypothetical protein
MVEKEEREFSTQDAAYVFLAFLTFFLIPTTYNYISAFFKLLKVKKLNQKCHCSDCNVHFKIDNEKKSKEVRKPFLSIFFVLYVILFITYIVVLSKVWQAPAAIEPYNPYSILGIYFIYILIIIFYI